MTAPSRWVFAAALAVASCNALLGNEPGYLDPRSGAGGAANGGAAGEAGASAAGAAGASEGGAVNTGCDAPDACMPGDTRTTPRVCGACGQGTQTRTKTCGEDCTWSPWTDFGPCSVVDECTPGQAPDVQTQPCGLCGKGTQTRSRTCTDACTWSEYGAWSACGNVDVECVPENAGGQGWKCCGAGSWTWCWNEGTENECTWTGTCAACSGCGC